MAQKNMVTLSQEELSNLIAQAVADALAKNSKKSGAKSRTSNKGTAKNTNKSASKGKKSNTTVKREVELEPVQLLYDDEELTVELNRFVRNRKVFGFVNKNVVECKGVYDRENKNWVFKNSRSLNKFLKVMEDVDLNTLTEEQLEEGANFSTGSTRTEEEKETYRARYQELWNKYVKECKEKGIKRTSEMNRVKSAEIKAQIA